MLTSPPRCVLPLLAAMLIGGCATPSAQASSDPPPDGGRWHVFDNGTRCITFPCPSWTAVSGEERVRVTGVDVSGLGLSEDAARKVQGELYAGRWIVRGRIVEGPEGPAGKARVLEILELLEEAPTPPGEAP